MQGHHEAETFNGSTAFIVYKLGAIQADLTNVKETAHRTEHGMQRLTRRLDMMSPRPASSLTRLARIPWKDMGGFLAALAVLVMAFAGKWEAISAANHLLGK
jgi:hypothetical protein